MKILDYDHITMGDIWEMQFHPERFTTDQFEEVIKRIEPIMDKIKEELIVIEANQILSDEN